MHTLLMENRSPCVIGFSLTHGGKGRSVQEDTKLSLFTLAEEKTIPCLPVKKKKRQECLPKICAVWVMGEGAGLGGNANRN